MARKKNPETVGRDVYVPVDSASLPGQHPGDAPISITKDHTRVREGHWLLEKYPHLFTRMHVHYDVETAEANLKVDE